MSLKQKLYDFSPCFVQHVLLNFYALGIHNERYGKQFELVLDELRKTEQFSPADLISYQQEKLINIIKYSYSNVPFYKSKFDSVGLKPTDIKSLADVEKIPLTTKDEVRQLLPQFISREVSLKSLSKGGTSGTTGTPLKVYWDRQTCVYTNAMDWRQKAWAGIEYGDNIALLLGRPVVAINRKSKPFWQLDRIHNQLWMSAFHLSDVNIPHYVEKINSFNARAIEGYPSTLYILADYLNRHDIKLKLKAVFSSSETLYPNQREAIEQAFDCKLFDFYGTAERVVFGTECHVHNGKHLNFEYGYSEIVDDQDRLVANGTKGYLVGSSLLNKGMPLIRYKTTDITSISSDLCSCGRSMPIMENITTKAEDIIVTPEGKQVSPSVLTHPFKMINGINKSQIIQNSIDDILIKLVVESDFNVTEEKKLIESFVDRVGTSVNVRVEYVKDIPRERSGKYRWVISHVPKESLLLN